MKTFVVDTNVLLHDPLSLFAFEDNNVVIPIAVIEELDNQKKRLDDVGRNARLVNKHIDAMRQIGSLSKGVKLPNGGNLRIELNCQDIESLPFIYDASPDNRVLSVAKVLSKKDENVFLVTKDLSLRIKADVVNVKCQDYYNDKVNVRDLYEETRVIEVTSLDINKFYQKKFLDLGERMPSATPNEFFLLKSQDGNQSALCRNSKGILYALVYQDLDCSGLKAKNKEQRFALELLLDNNIKVVSLLGPAGTGKTLLSLAVGLELCVEQQEYDRLLITRPTVSVGQDIGFLPGEKDEKLRPWMQPIYDNLECLYNNKAKKNMVVEYLTSSGKLEFEALTYIRGRSIPKQFILVDEAQNLTKHQIKTLITRVGEDTKIVFTGDPDQIDTPYLDSSTNGLVYLTEKFKDQDIFGYVTLLKSERSKVAELGAKLL